MAISTYAELKTALADWSHRADLTSKMGDFITLAESRLNDVLRILAHEVDSTVAASARFVSFPTGMVELLSVSLDYTTYRTPLQQVSPEVMDALVNTGSTPEYFCVTDQIELDCSYTGNLIVRNISKFTLSDGSPTNSLLTNYPNVYLFGALAELWAYVKDPDETMKWEMKFKEAVRLATLNAHRSKADTPLTTEVAQMIEPASYNIIGDA